MAIYTTVATNPNNILFNREPLVTIGIQFDGSAIAPDPLNGNKMIAKAGTPVTGSLINRAVPFVASGLVAVPAIDTKAVQTLLITAAAAAAGNVGIQLGYRANVDIAVLLADNEAAIATKIAAGTFPGWTAVVDPADVNGETVLFTATDPGHQPEMVVTPNATGVTSTVAVTTVGNYVPAGASVSNAVGVLLHDCDCTLGTHIVNTQAILGGLINRAKLDAATLALATAAVQAKLAPMIQWVL